MKATQWMGIVAALVLFALPVRAEEAKAQDAQKHENAGGGNHFWERWNNLTPEQKQAFLRKHPHFRERVANWMADRGDRREHRRERRLERRAERREKRLERRERRAERRERRQERRQDRRENRQEGRTGGR